ncbi:Radical SAM superfamily protein [Caloramator mitchellensis]|uniref:Radical SAM superfamily protein n=1 Tax=Caloramator mitchellensis TaxID=908809 RepID=A0A0R3JRL9_CALMK|nr:radical SAM protein [Caloramator mitchellensis]KRQ86131.1 Radical SAM superfamily protein [Caloramator mitchellensis]
MKGIRFVVTYSCNFMCSICRFKCAPFKKGFMPVDKFYEHFLSAFEEGYRDYIIIEGGEAFLDIARVYKYLKKIKNYCLKKYIVTNGYWGDIDIYYSVLNDLKKIGLNGLIIEYDYFHKPFIQEKTILNAIRSALCNNLNVTLRALLKTDNLSCIEDTMTIKNLKDIKDKFEDLNIIFETMEQQSLKGVLNKRWALEEKLILYDK